MDHLNGKAAVITGASRGIGAAAARFFAARGALVVLAARSTNQTEAIAAEIRSAGGGAQAIACDVADPAAIEAAIATCETAFGRFDFLVNNAGLIDPIGRIEDLSPADYGRVIDVNLKGVFNGLSAALPRLTRRGEGVIVNISSGAATSALEGWSHYCSSKAGVLSLTRCAERENQDSAVRVVGLSPGTVATEMQVQIKASGINPVSQLDPDAHIPAEWAARAIAWLCGPDAAEFRGVDVSLRDEDIRRRVGLIA
ncbi:MAG: SDR family oxidoreductase [Pseudomonadota bacterium]